jgi:hypothetical protein
MTNASGIAGSRKGWLECYLMSTKSRQSIYGSRIRGARIRADGAREEAVKAVRAADRAEAEAWSIRMEGWARATIADNRSMLQWRPRLARGRMQSLQDPRERPRSMPYAARTIRQSGNLKDRSDADPAARVATSRLCT